jgi:membrane dipeptidase
MNYPVSLSIRISLVIFISAVFAGALLGEDPIDKLHRDAVVWDCHNDLAYRVLYEGLDIGNRLPGGHVDIPRLKEGGVDVQVVALYPEVYTYPGNSARQTRQLLDAMLKVIEKNSDSVELARTGADIERIIKSGKIAMPLAIEGGHALEDRIELLREFHSKGVSSMTLTHNIHHGWADCAAKEPKWNGLNDLGREVVREMNRLGMVIDLSHVSDQTFFDTLEITDAPVICSHSACRAITPNNRNVSDDMLRALAKNDGVVGIIFVLNFISTEYRQASRELRAIEKPWFDKIPVIEDLDMRIAVEHLYRGHSQPLEGIPTIDVVLDHIDHAVKIAGVDHVGLGADMYPRIHSPVGIRGVHDYPNISKGLKKRGYDDEAIKKIMGGNFLRVWKAVTDHPSR